MPREMPAWWRGDGRAWPAALLSPAGTVWSAATRLRWLLVRPARAPVPVICIGNLTVGGAGKTPAAIAVARLLQEAGETPVFLTRGYGGRLEGPHPVDPEHDSSHDVGDEPLLLARIAPVVVAADRAKGVQAAGRLGAGAIVMDDGFQNPGLAKDLSLVVVDRAYGIGNGRVIPAGPLRAPLDFQLAKADGLILIGEGSAAEAVSERMKAAGKPVFSAALAPAGDTTWLREKSVVAFAGIGDPEKFFRMLEGLGARLAGRFAFPDHHRFTEADANTLLAAAQRESAMPVTTEKDWVRLEGTGAIERLRETARPVPIELEFGEKTAVKQRLAAALQTHKAG